MCGDENIINEPLPELSRCSPKGQMSITAMTRLVSKQHVRAAPCCAQPFAFWHQISDSSCSGLNLTFGEVSYKMGQQCTPLTVIPRRCIYSSVSYTLDLCLLNCLFCDLVGWGQVCLIVIYILKFKVDNIGRLNIEVNVTCKNKVTLRLNSWKSLASVIWCISELEIMSGWSFVQLYP